jgi:hypothetical protein
VLPDARVRTRRTSPTCSEGLSQTDSASARATLFRWFVCWRRTVGSPTTPFRVLAGRATVGLQSLGSSNEQWSLVVVVLRSKNHPRGKRSSHSRRSFAGSQHEFHWIRCTHQPSPWIGDYGWFLMGPQVSASAKFCFSFALIFRRAVADGRSHTGPRGVLGASRRRDQAVPVRGHYRRILLSLSSRSVTHTHTFRVPMECVLSSHRPCTEPFSE